MPNIETSLEIFKMSFSNDALKQGALRRLLGYGTTVSQKYTHNNVTKILTPPDASLYIVEEGNTLFVGINKGAKEHNSLRTAVKQIRGQYMQVMDAVTSEKIKTAIKNMRP